MKINSLTLTNIRSHSATKFDLRKKITVFVGKNATGKTSIADSLAFLTTGRTDRTSKNGEGREELMTFGEGRALVSANFEDIGSVSRNIPHNFQIADWKNGLREQEKKFYDMIGMSPITMLSSIYSWTFLDMNPADQKNFMFDLLNMNISNESVKREFLSWCQNNSIDNYEQLWRYIETLGITFDKITVFDGIYRILCENRKAIKKEVKNYEIQIKSYKSKLPKGLTIDHRDSVIEQLTELKVKRDDLLIEIGTIQNASKQIKVLEDKVSQKRKLSTPIEIAEFLRNEITKCQNELTKANRLASKKQGEITAIQSHVTKLSKFDGTCPISSEIKCNVSKKDLEILKTTLESSLTKKKNELIILENNTKIIISKLKIFQNKYDERIKSDTLLPEIEKAEIELNKLKNISSDISTKQSQLDEFNVRLTKGQNYLMLIEAEREQIQRIDEIRRNFDEKSRNLSIVEVLVDAFSSRGLKSLMLNRATKPLEDRVNERMNVLTDGDYKVNFRIDEEDYNIYLISDGIERKVRNLSKSEKMRLGIIMQDAINSLVGSRLLVVDEVDMLDAENKKLFMQLINLIKDDYDNIILLITGTGKLNIQQDDTTVYYLKRRRMENESF